MLPDVSQRVLVAVAVGGAVCGVIVWLGAPVFPHSHVLPLVDVGVVFGAGVAGVSAYRRRRFVASPPENGTLAQFLSRTLLRWSASGVGTATSEEDGPDGTPAHIGGSEARPRQPQGSRAALEEPVEVALERRSLLLRREALEREGRHLLAEIERVEQRLEQLALRRPSEAAIVRARRRPTRREPVAREHVAATRRDVSAYRVRVRQRHVIRPRRLQYTSLRQALASQSRYLPRPPFQRVTDTVARVARYEQSLSHWLVGERYTTHMPQTAHITLPPRSRPPQPARLPAVASQAPDAVTKELVHTPHMADRKR